MALPTQKMEFTPNSGGDTDLLFNSNLFLESPVQAESEALIEATTKAVADLIIDITELSEVSETPGTLSEACLSISSPFSEVEHYVDEGSLIKQVDDMMVSCVVSLGERSGVESRSSFGYIVMLNQLNGWISSQPEVVQALRDVIDMKLNGQPLQLPYVQVGYDEHGALRFSLGSTLVHSAEEGLGMYSPAGFKDAVRQGTIVLPGFEDVEVEALLKETSQTYPGAGTMNPPAGRGRKGENNTRKLFLALMGLGVLAGGVALAYASVEAPEALAAEPGDIDSVPAVAPDFEYASPTPTEAIPTVTYDPATGTVVAPEEGAIGPVMATEEGIIPIIEREIVDIFASGQYAPFMKEGPSLEGTLRTYYYDNSTGTLYIGFPPEEMALEPFHFEGAAADRIAALFRDVLHLEIDTGGTYAFGRTGVLAMSGLGFPEALFEVKLLPQGLHFILFRPSGAGGDPVEAFEVGIDEEVLIRQYLSEGYYWGIVYNTNPEDKPHPVGYPGVAPFQIPGTDS